MTPAALAALKVLAEGATPNRMRPEYVAWTGMIGRCTNPNNHAFDRYGGRGITMCERWRRSFADFYADMGPRPSPKHSIDRIDNDGPYSPENCRWATREEQARNKRTTIVVEAFGERMPLGDWADRLKVPVRTLWDRIFVQHMAPERALVRGHIARETGRVVELNGEKHTVTEWAKRLGVSPRTLSGRLDRGLSPAEALTSAPQKSGRKPNGVPTVTLTKDEHAALVAEVERLRAALEDEYAGWTYAPEQDEVRVCIGCTRIDAKSAQRAGTWEEIQHLPGCALRSEP